jgi:hypothetical protein
MRLERGKHCNDNSTNITTDTNLVMPIMALPTSQKASTETRNSLGSPFLRLLLDWNKTEKPHKQRHSW